MPRAFSIPLKRAGYPRCEDLPYGAVVAVAELVNCVPSAELESILSEREREFGYYGPGRFGWVLENVRPLTPIPVAGKQGLWQISRDLLNLE